MGRPIGSNTQYRYTIAAEDFPLVTDHWEISSQLRKQFLKMGFKSKCIRSYGLDNPFSTEDARVIMIKSALTHGKMEIEVVIA